MNAQFHAPSFGDEVIYDLPDIETNGTGGVSNAGISTTTLVQPQQQQSKRVRSMDQSIDEYHSANDDSFGPLPGVHTVATPPTTTLAARKQLSSGDTTNEPAKPLSAYGLFFRDTVSAIKQQNPNCTFQELSRIVASMWEALDVTHKNVYNKKHELALTEYCKQMRTFRQQMEQQQQQQQQEQLVANDANNANSATLQTKPAVFTITRFNTDAGSVNNAYAAQATPAQQILPNNVTVAQAGTAVSNSASAVSAASATTQPPTTATTDPSPPQMQMLTEAGAVQKCTRENCNKRAIINPDWEDEYCSNECVVIHCRNVFNTWVQSNLESRKQ